MPLGERNDPIETLPPGRPNEAFTVRVRLRGAHRRLQHLQRHRPESVVHGGCENAVAIVDDESIGTVKGQAVATLLDGPARRGMRGDIPLHDPAGRDVEENET